MADLSTLSDAELMALYKQQQQPVQAKPQDLSKMSDAELMALYNQQRTGAAQSPIERPDMLTTALEFQGRPAEQVGATLADLVPPPELAADLLKAKSPQGGMPTESNVQAIVSQLEQTGSIRDVLNKEVASGGLSPTATLDPKQYPVLAPIWEQYKKEMDPSFLGAMARGAESQAGAVVGGAIGAGLGSMGAPVTGPVTPFLGRMGGAVVGAELQKAAESAFRTPQEQLAAQAQAAFDASRTSTRVGTAIGETAPHLLTMRPALNTIQQAIAGDANAIAAVAMGSALGAAVPAATGGGVERTVVGAVTGGLMEPRIAPRTPAVTPAQVQAIQAAEQAGIPVYTQDVFRPQGRMGQALQRAGEVLPFGTTSQRITGQQATQRAAEETFRRLGVELSELGQTGTDRALNAVFQSFERRRGRVIRQSQIQRQQAMQAADATGLPVPLTNSLPAIDNAINQLRSNDLLRDAAREVERIRDALVGGNLGTLESVRQSVGELFDAPNLANVRTQGSRAISNLYGPINEDIAAFIQQHGRPNDLTRWRVANAAITRLNREREVAAINHVLNTGGETPEVIRRLIFNAPESTQAVLYDQLSTVGRRNLRTAIMQRAYEDSTFNGQFSPTRFLRQLDNLSSNLNMSFTPAQQAELTGLARAIQLTERNQRFAPNAETGVQAVPGQVMSMITKGAKTVAGMAGAAGLVAHPVETLLTGALATGLTVGLGGLSRMYNSEVVRRGLVRLSTAPQGTEAEKNAYRALTLAIQAEARKNTPKQESQ
jgi:hypothetical protein